MVEPIDLEELKRELRGGQTHSGILMVADKLNEVIRCLNRANDPGKVDRFSHFQDFNPR